MKKILLKVLIVSLVVPSLYVFGGCNQKYISITDEAQIVECLSKDSSEIRLKLKNDLSITTEMSALFSSEDEVKQNVVIDLGGKTLTYSANINFNIADGSTLTLKNGKMRFDTNGNVNTGNITVFDNSKLILDDVEYYATGNNIVAIGEANVEIKNSKLSGQTYCVSTNASKEENYNPNITIENTELTSRGYGYIEETNESDYDDATILINVPCKLNMNNCTLTGNRQALIVRGGEAVVKNCTITNTSLYGNKTQYLSSNWGSGDEVPMAGVVLGNRSSAYQYSAKLTLSNTTITTDNEQVPTIYAYSSNPSGSGATLKYNQKDATKLGIENAVINEESNVLVIVE